MVIDISDKDLDEALRSFYQGKNVIGFDDSGKPVHKVNPELLNAQCIRKEYSVHGAPLETKCRSWDQLSPELRTDYQSGFYNMDFLNERFHSYHPDFKEE
ncbi:hypothetical protein HN385_04060 [archaeon]|jgi:hypothetical protein|nr:hypothetical protein [archaeon]MBT3451662.1 hypothetical protein [archaeon]MBT6869106.1 hypothetical protein [archaeon]MBT7193349.1 hypothetical protein [archaeon]MBT7380357.1 hypothetical protein [archaeon]